MTLPLWLHGIIAFFTCLAFGVVFRVPKRALLSCGIAGAAGWLAYGVALLYFNNVMISSLCGGFAVACIAELSASVLRCPVTVFAVPGIIMLVPGLLAFDAMDAFLEGNYTAGLGMVIQTLFIAGAITTGLVLAGAIISGLRTSLRKKNVIIDEYQEED
jgi:uncharacterized membrane protein YjjB (DUF3815 family)